MPKNKTVKSKKLKIASSRSRFFKNPVFIAVIIAVVGLGSLLAYRSFALSPVPCNRTVKSIGSSGDCVVQIQLRVNEILGLQAGFRRTYTRGYIHCGGYSGKIAVDGAFGPQTRNAVTAIQIIANIQHDGVVGPVTWAVMDACTGWNSAQVYGY